MGQSFLLPEFIIRRVRVWRIRRCLYTLFWFLLFSVDVWKYLIEQRLALGFFARAAGEALSLGVAAAAVHFSGVWEWGRLASCLSRAPGSKRYQTLQVSRGIKVRNTCSKAVFGKNSLKLLFLLLERCKNKDMRSAVCK